MKASNQIEFYRTCLTISPLFAELSPATLDALAAVSRIASFSPNERINSRDDELSFSGVVISGGIRTSMTTADGYEFSQSILRRGAYFGSIGIVDPVPAMWDSNAHGATEMVVIQHRDFRTVLAAHSDLSLLLVKATNYRLRKAYALMSNLLLDTLEQRLRRTLVMLVGAAEGAGRGRMAEIAITQEALGQFIHCSRPTVNKLLRDLEIMGIVEIGYGVLRVIDLPALRRSFENETILTL
jgi:CRP-like cAMP-binding protein